MTLSYLHYDVFTAEALAGNQLAVFLDSGLLSSERMQRIARERNAERVGGVEEVLVEGPSRTDPTLLRGRTRRNTTVNFRGEVEAGELVEVRIESATSTTLAGTAAAALADTLS